MNKIDLKTLLSKDEIQKVLDAVLEISQTQGSNLHNDAIHLSSRFNGYLRELNSGTVSKEELEIRLNNIRNSLGFLIDRLPEKEFTVTSVIVQPLQSDNITVLSQPLGDTPQSPPSDSGKQLPAQQADNMTLPIPWIAGLGLLVGMVVLLIFVPCPTTAQFFTFRLVLALAAGGMVSQLPGMFGFEWGLGIKAAGAVGFAVMIWLVNPGSIIGKDKCNSGPFNLTVRLQTPNLPEYPPLKGGNLKIWVVDDYKKPELNSDKVAVVKGIPASEEGRRVDTYLENASHWKLKVDSMTLSSTSQTLQAIPDGSLSEVSGKVKSDQGNIPLEGVMVEVKGVKDTTDNSGNFKLSIPVEHQKKEYVLSATPLKKGFQPLTTKVYAGKDLDIHLLNNSRK